MACHRRVQRFASGIHGNDQLPIRLFQDLLPHTLSLTANNHRHCIEGCAAQVLRPGGQRRHRHRDSGITAGILYLLPGTLDHRCAEHCAHGSPNHLVAVRIGTAFQQHHRCLQRISRPQNGSQIARILDAVQDQHTRHR